MRNKIQLLILVLLPFQMMGQESIPELLKMQALFAQGEYQEVLSGNFIPANSRERQLYYYLKGNCAFYMDKPDEAIKFFKQAELINRGSAALELAHCYIRKNDQTQMFKYLAEHLESPYKKPRKEIMLDPEFSNLDRNREWIRFWSKSWYNETDDMIAEAQYQIKKNDLNETFWFDVIQKSEGYASILVLTAQYYQLVGKDNKAGQAFVKANSIDPDNLEVNILFGEYLIEKNEFDQAIKVFNRMISQNPYNISLYLDRVLAIFKSGRSNRGIEEINRLVKLGIDASSLYFLLAKGLIQENPVKAIEYLDPVLNEKPTAAAFNLRAKAQQALGDDREAIKDFSMSLDINPKQVLVYFERARLRMKIGDLDGACYDWQNALQLGHRKAADMLYKYCK